MEVYNFFKIQFHSCSTVLFVGKEICSHVPANATL